MQIRLLIATLMLLLAMVGKAQVFQINNTPMNFARGLKARDLLIAPKGCDTTALSNPKWGESTAGALFVDTCNNRLYFFNGLKWNQVTGGVGGVDSFYFNFRNLNDTTLLWDRGDGVVDTLAFSSGTSLIGSYVDSIRTVGDSLYEYKGGISTLVANLAAAVVGGDTTNLSTVDSTGQPARRVLISAPGNKIVSNRFFLYDTTQRKLVIGAAVLGVGGSVQLYVQGKIATGSNFIGDTASVNYTGLGSKIIRYNSDSMRVYGLVPVTDTGRFKPMAYDPTNNTWSYASSWPSGSDTTGLGSLYIRNQFATQENKSFNIRSGRLDSLYASGSGGVHFATNGGTSAFEYGGGGGTQVTFNGFAGYNANRAASYTARSFTDKNYVDSARNTIPTVTSYGKNTSGDSTVLVLSNGQRFAAKDSTGGGGGGITGIGTFASTGDAKGLSISGSNLIAHAADSTNPGMVTVADQFFRGVKNFIATRSQYQANYINNIDSSGASAGFSLQTARAGDGGWRIGFRTNQDNGWFEMTAGVELKTIYRRWHEYSDLMASSGTIGWTNSSPITGSGLANRETYIARQAAGRLRITTSATEGGVEFTESGGYTMGIRTSSTNQAWMEMHNNGNVKSRWVNFEYLLGSSGQLGFAANDFSAVNVSGRDVAIKRNAAGVIEINNGTAGTFRDLIVRAISPNGESMAIGSNTTNASAIASFNSTSKGLLPPRMTTTQMNAISSPAAGLMIYNTTENATMTYDGTRWVGFRYNGTVYQGYNSTANVWTDLN